MSFNLLSEPIRKFIRSKGWDQLRPIQSAAISKILASDENFILASRTASGKTEAAFLPILSKVNFYESGVQVLYISPLIALINDQFYRIEELCKNLDVQVTKWHGEANKTLKEKLIKAPNGIVLITPESLEAMFVNKPYNIKQLFSNLKYVVVDEIHSFIGSDRGTQLKSILSRLQDINTNNFSIIGLSATIGDYNEAKNFTGNEHKTKVLLDSTPKEINAKFRFFKNENEELPIELLKDLYLETKDNKVLIFPNSRGRAEEVAVKLRKISDRVKGHPNYFSHHSSVDKEVREYVEYFAKNNNRQNFCISCTSTLELGIDIGTVDEVVQIDATHSIASLIQRVGRSGRKDGEKSNLYLYATNKWTLLQAISCWLLYKENYIEPPQKNDRPYDILVHQALSITKGKSGIKLAELINQLKRNFSFVNIDQNEIKEILEYLIDIDFLERIQTEVIIGIEGEKIVNNREFYSVFKTEESFKVVNSGNTIGEIPFTTQIIEDENIFLSARIWKIKYIDQKAKKIEVIPTKDGKIPKFLGIGVIIHQKIREKMFEVLYSTTEYDFLDNSSYEELEIMRKEFSVFNINNFTNERPLLSSEKEIILYTFTGTKINRTIQLLLNIVGIKNNLDEKTSTFEIEIPKQDLFQKWEDLLESLPKIDTHISNLLQQSPSILDFSKWGNYLPDNYKVKLLKDKYFDIAETLSYLEELKLVENK
ncbi:DEAD/DEAH box helicase [Sediminibacterium sp. TEGAF015]|uniref:DEAD/DEAH box helicase n=1 Tax=Sediminibacterium sp. TEGAF015 TaxID=575378 RepID=UPI0021FF8060|nr:DEAD/DEAH box helicase [Sediminibacterium sp. TEGAF015]BDQ11692.1 ATP-dependent helicase [Sediminibacterium sp. TEGAF015]